MSEIFVSPPQLRQVSSEINQRARRLAIILADIESTIDRLDSHRFQGTQANEVRNRYKSIRERIRAFPGLIMTFARELEEIANVFELEDTKLLNNGLVLLSAGGGLSGVLSFGWVQTWTDRLRDWFSNLIPAPFSEPVLIATPVQEQPPSEPVRSAFGDLLAKYDAEQESSQALTPEESLARNAHQVPLFGQGSKGGYAACTPTSISMVMKFWSDQDAQNTFLDTDAVLKESVDRKFFSQGVGMDFYEAEAVLDAHNYDAEVRQFGGGDSTATKDQLKSALETQPVIAMIQLDMKAGSLAATGGVPHAVVVTGMSDDGSLVQVLNPWGQGTSVDMTWDAFQASWSGFDDKYDYFGIVTTPGGE